MIVYSNSIEKFYDEVSDIASILNNKFKDVLHKYSNKREIESWNNSLSFFANILTEANLENSVTIALEYNLPLTSNRIDLMLSGYKKDKTPIVLIFELKQWEYISDISTSDYLVKTFLNGSEQRVVHPGYQVLSYTSILNSYNKYIQDECVELKSCLLMHNYEIKDEDIINQEKYNSFMKEVFCFGKNDKEKLIDFLKSNLVFGDNGKIINNIENSVIMPSFKLQNEINNLIINNPFFNLIDQQVEIYDKILSLLKENQNNVIIVNGGPGTGKSVLAINLLNALTKKGKTCQYVSRNTAPRAVYSYKMKSDMKKTDIDFLFKSSGSYTETIEKNINTLIVDEAHCLTEKSGLFSNYGVNQILEIIKSSNNSIFFIDELQQVHLNDIGTIKNIKTIAEKLNYKVTELSLDYQFRCNGSNEYLSFVDYILGYKDDYEKESINYDFQVFDTPQALFDSIKEKNKKSLARLVAGYCWNWNKKEMNNTDYHDIKIGDFEISWNLGQSQTFVIDDSINEVGCIHSVQGLEFDYVGVIIGKDVKYENDKVITDYFEHGSADPSFKGIKKVYKENEKEAKEKADILIKNAYRVLLTRGSKGCYVYCEDEKYRDFINNTVRSINFKQ